MSNMEIVKLQEIKQNTKTTYHITIPARFIDELELEKGDHIGIERKEDHLIVKKVGRF